MWGLGQGMVLSTTKKGAVSLKSLSKGFVCGHLFGVIVCLLGTSTLGEGSAISVLAYGALLDIMAANDSFFKVQMCSLKTS